MKIFVFGANGMLGNTVSTYLTEVGFDVFNITRKDIDLSEIKKEELSVFLHSKMEVGEGDVIINCAGLIKQRKDVPSTHFISVNSLFPNLLAEFKDVYKYNFIHITTDCIFSGKDGNYTENNRLDVDDIYGVSKFMGEQNTNSTIIRTSIIGEEENNKLSLLEWVRSNEGGYINGYTNHIWNGVTCLQLAKNIEKIMVDNLYWSGVRHVFSPKLNKFDLVSIINEIYNLKINITPTESESIIDRSLSSIKEVIIDNPHLYKQIEETKKFHNSIRDKRLGNYYEKLI